LWPTALESGWKMPMVYTWSSLSGVYIVGRQILKNLPWSSYEPEPSNGGKMTNKTQNKTIVIAGDSWACGEWRDDGMLGRGISHPGLSEYLTNLGYLVVNLGKAGGSNINSIERVSDFLKVSSYLKISHVFVFQTEWIRDIKFEDEEILVEDIATGYLSLKMRLISRFYYKLSRVAQQAKVTIHIIGGCSDTIWLSEFTKEYPGVEIACQSMTNLLLTGNHRIADPVYAVITSQFEEQVKSFKKTMDSNNLELLLADMDEGKQRLWMWEQEKRFFWPDGAHANQTAHNILFDFLKTQISDL
jgi:hypothetical protein